MELAGREVAAAHRYANGKIYVVHDAMAVVVARKSNGQRVANGVEQKASHKPTVECDTVQGARGCEKGVTGS